MNISNYLETNYLTNVFGEMFVASKYARPYMKNNRAARTNDRRGCRRKDWQRKKRGGGMKK